MNPFNYLLLDAFRSLVFALVSHSCYPLLPPFLLIQAVLRAEEFFKNYFDLIIK
jgi:hypothetical protein